MTEDLWPPQDYYEAPLDGEKRYESTQQTVLAIALLNDLAEGKAVWQASPIGIEENIVTLNDIPTGRSSIRLKGRVRAVVATASLNNENAVDLATFDRESSQRVLEKLHEPTYADLFWLQRDTPDPYDQEYKLFPYLKPEEIEMMRAKTASHNGILTAFQGEYAIVSADDTTVKELSTYGISTGDCRGVLLYNRQTNAAAIAHIDSDGDDSFVVEQMRQGLLDNDSRPEDLVFFGSPHINSMQQEIYAEKFGEAHFNLPNSFTFDRQTKKVTDIGGNPAEITRVTPPDANMRLARITTRINNNVPCLRVY